MHARIIYPGIDGPDTHRLSKALTEDLERIVAGHQPTAAELSAAPIIDNWLFVPRPETALAGLISGHPLLGAGPGVTSGIFALDEAHSWVRTWTRWYRLGRQAGDDQMRRQQ
jgi:hypothetical protein